MKYEKKQIISAVAYNTAIDKLDRLIPQTVADTIVRLIAMRVTWGCGKVYDVLQDIMNLRETKKVFNYLFSVYRYKVEGIEVAEDDIEGVFTQISKEYYTSFNGVFLLTFDSCDKATLYCLESVTEKADNDPAKNSLVPVTI